LSEELLGNRFNIDIIKKKNNWLAHAVDMPKGLFGIAVAVAVQSAFSLRNASK
jgi:hypothetical protein